MRADLLHEILEPSPRAETSPGAPPGLRERGLLLGLDLDRPSRVALVVGRPPVAGRLATPDADREALTRALAAALTRAHVPHLIGPHGPRVAIVVQGDPDLEAILEDLGDVGVQVACGVGRAVERSGDLPLSLRDASVALEQSRARRGPRIMRYDDLDLMSWLILEVGEDAVRSKAEAVLAPLADRPELHETLVEYLRQSMDVPATARRLHVHQNSMRHRLGRIEQLLGRSLRSAPDLAAIHVALLITSAVGTPPSASSPSSDSV
jgi:purine catabolism regulator